jgi:RsiW-degrading membrane proteinase PrsW (M82 family)
MVYANDTFGDIGVSENATFTIALTPIVKPEPFPTTIAAVLGVSAVVFVAGLLVYFKKRKPATQRKIEGQVT